MPLLAPVVTEGTIDVSGGLAGSITSGASGATRSAGAGGGGSDGQGGDWRDVAAGNPTNPEKGGRRGDPGLLLVDLVDPTALF